MRKTNEAGSTTAIVSILLGILLIGTIYFAQWAYRSRQDYKNNTDQKVNTAVASATAAQAAKDQQVFAQEAKNPNKTFQSSPTYGSITFKYPKTWSSYIDTTNQSQPIEGYLYPDTVPGIQSDTAYALRVELVSEPYSQVLQQFNSQLQQGTATATAYVPPQMVGKPNVQPGTKFSGVIATSPTGTQEKGSLVAIQVRDKTLEIYTESQNFLPDFNDTVLDSLTFVP